MIFLYRYIVPIICLVDEGTPLTDAFLYEKFSEVREVNEEAI